MTSIPEGKVGNTDAGESSAGMSPYASGGGGVTFERKVAVQYLAHLLVGDGAVEFGEGRRAVSVAFQQAPDHPVDDLIIRAARPEEVSPSLELALGVRRSPKLVLSDESTQKLVRDFVRALLNVPADGPEARLGLVVAGPQQHAQQLSTLSGLAAVQMDAPGFFDLVYTPNRFNASIRGRLEQLVRLVEKALQDLGVASPELATVRQLTWQLLSRLEVLMPRLESPDETDWSEVENKLVTVARGLDLSGAEKLRDRLLTLSSDYSPISARVNLEILRRDAHETLDTNFRRYQQGWQMLDHLHGSALESFRDEITDSDGVRRVRIDRSESAASLVERVREADAVVVGGQSGVGKSALTLVTLSAVYADTMQSICINLRQLPKLTVDFEARLGLPLSTLLGELSAPLRMLVIDGADAVTEGMEDAFRYLVSAAKASGVKVVAVSGMDSMEVVYDILSARFGESVARYQVEPLTDTELYEIVKTFPEMEGLTSNSQSHELLRRLVVIDLLVRGQLSGAPLTEADAMQQVWSRLVRRQERSDRGHPDTRESVLLRLADLSLKGSNRLDVINQFDATAITGLRQDGLLQRSNENPFISGPDFAHDEVRRYAVARLLLADMDPTSRILSAGAPRWALGATRLACQAWLDEPDTTASPLRGRFAALQMSFDALVEAGHGTRWGDVPSEALLTLVDPREMLRDAWVGLQADDDAGLRRIARLVDQRLRKDNGLVDNAAIEPIIELLLEDDTPWGSGKHVADLLRDWLLAHVFAGTPASHPLRNILREHLVNACAVADMRLAEQMEAEAAERAARTTEEIERERQILESQSAMFSQITYGGRPRRQRSEVPHEYRDEAFLELLALLGPDLGDDGERILRRVAEDAPGWLAPALEGLLVDRSLASYGGGLLAHLTEAYYLDDEPGGLAFDDDGIRDHRSRSLHLPLAAWHRGPFMALFQTDFRRGVAVLNRILNHAALNRSRILARLYQMSQSIEDIDDSPFRPVFEITGTRRPYVGDEHVWMWYRGTGVGPYPCMSALQALERTCDQLIGVGIPIKTLVPLLLDGCENLAMVGLVVGILARHLEASDDLLDPYLTEPLIWNHEFRRVANEHSWLAADSDGLEAPERRMWSFRETAMLMALRAENERVADLRALGETLIERARRRIEQGIGAESTEKGANGSEGIEVQLATVRVWASSLDRGGFQVHDTPDGLRIQATPPKEVVEVLQNDNKKLELVAEEIRLVYRYFLESQKADSEVIGADELATDVASARRLREAPTSLSAYHPWDAPTLVAAAVLEAYLLRRVDLPTEVLSFAVDTVLRVSESEVSPSHFEFEETYFEQGASRSAARVVPLLLMPTAAQLRASVDGADGSTTFGRASVAGLKFALAIANEVRLHLARGFDYLWTTPCVQAGTCHHQAGWQIVTEMIRDCAIGDWNPDTGRRSVILLGEPLAESLSNTADDSILPDRLDASIRALAPASAANICVSTSARDFLTILLTAQRRSLLSHKNSDMRGTHSLVSARALLTLAQHGDDTAIYEHVNAYGNNAALLEQLLYALSAAAEETQDRAATARRIWPSVIRYVLDLHKSGHKAFQDGVYGEMALAALIPNVAPEFKYFYREIQEKPIVWWEMLALNSEVEDWLETAIGNANCVDQLISFLRVFEEEKQARVGLPWVSTLVLGNPKNIAKRSFMSADWLIETRSAVASVGLSARWQQVVDALVVEGVSRLAPYSE